MEFKFLLDSEIYCMRDYNLCKSKVSAISISKDRVLYTCDDLIVMQENELFLTKEECKKALKDKLDKKLKDLDAL